MAAHSEIGGAMLSRDAGLPIPDAGSPLDWPGSLMSLPSFYVNTLAIESAESAAPLVASPRDSTILSSASENESASSPTLSSSYTSWDDAQLQAAPTHAMPTSVAPQASRVAPGLVSPALRPAPASVPIPNGSGFASLPHHLQFMLAARFQAASSGSEADALTPSEQLAVRSRVAQLASHLQRQRYHQATATNLLDPPSGLTSSMPRNPSCLQADRLLVRRRASPWMARRRFRISGKSSVKTSVWCPLDGEHAAGMLCPMGRLQELPADHKSVTDLFENAFCLPSETSDEDDNTDHGDEGGSSSTDASPPPTPRTPASPSGTALVAMSSMLPDSQFVADRVCQPNRLVVARLDCRTGDFRSAASVRVGQHVRSMALHTTTDAVHLYVAAGTKLRLFRPTDGELRCVWSKETDGVLQQLERNASRPLLLLGGFSGVVRCLDLGRTESVRRRTEFSSCVYRQHLSEAVASLAWRPQSLNTFSVALDNNQLELRDLCDTGRAGVRLHMASTAYGHCWLDAQTLATGHDAGAVALWDVRMATRPLQQFHLTGLGAVGHLRFNATRALLSCDGHGSALVDFSGGHAAPRALVSVPSAAPSPHTLIPGPPQTCLHHFENDALLAFDSDGFFGLPTPLAAQSASPLLA
ncbi:uncharacterized protein MONBRDRAFT_26558 [Monosiga brevicollis MX1]|uniref:Uncharacterized protein n=1 Tax=Monosiga brevicollis TaxID=81824 RepID=A9V2Q4_MONBE|nr:uncharacterized protein MONBRDRAFT_26558 [Monosiga brevicollis MX1]EDQ88302.1 predicted protein [Monosiga brevicollis MX1]|eukprot:XP_001746895.1 hypothetical protein [Monosiga brevicollis MX1]